MFGLFFPLDQFTEKNDFFFSPLNQLIWESILSNFSVLCGAKLLNVYYVLLFFQAKESKPYSVELGECVTATSNAQHNEPIRMYSFSREIDVFDYQEFFFYLGHLWCIVYQVQHP